MVQTIWKDRRMHACMLKHRSGVVASMSCTPHAQTSKSGSKYVLLTTSRCYKNGAKYLTNTKSKYLIEEKRWLKMSQYCPIMTCFIGFT